MTTARSRFVALAMLSATATLAITPMTTAGASVTPTAAPSLAPLVGTDAERAIPGDYIVVLHDSATAPRTLAVSAVATAAGGEIHHTYGAALNGFAATLPPDALSAVRASADVAYVEADHVVSLPAEVHAAKTTQKKATWGLDRIDQRDLPLNNKYVYTPTGAGVTAFMLDTGIRATHTDFSGRVLAGVSFIDDTNGTNDCQGHGTHTAGTVGGEKWGVAKDVSLVPVRVLDCEGYGTDSGVIAGIDWVTANATEPAVANMSLGGDASQALDDAVTRSIESGVQYAISAGNDSWDACEYSPARTDLAVTVGATSSDDFVAWYSNWGDCLDIWAPGDYITSASNKNDTASTVKDGTSMAAPHVTGVMALYLQDDPDATPAELRDKLVSKSSKSKLYGVFGPNRLLYSR